MAVIGKMQDVMQEGSDSVMRNYEKNDLYRLAEDFLMVPQAALDEHVSIDMFAEPQKFFSTQLTNNSMKRWFRENAFDPKDPDINGDNQIINEKYAELETLFDHDVQGIMEAAPLSAYNPVVGITFPIHKNLLMTTVFDKGAIPKDVAAGPQFTLSMETRTLVSPDGREIDMFLEQNKIKGIVESSIPRKDVVFNLPEDYTTDVLTLLGAVSRSTANISRSSKITKLIVSGVWTVKGDEYYDDVSSTIKVYDQEVGAVKKHVFNIPPIRFQSVYGQMDRGFTHRGDLVVATDGTGTTEIIKFTVYGSMHKNKFSFVSTNPRIVGLVMSAALDVSSAAYETPKVKWSVRTDMFEIPEAPHITVTISPEETRDIQAMYNVSQLTKLMSMIKLTLVNYKDDKILADLDESFLNLPDQNKVSSAFDFAPPDNFLGSHITWRYETFMDHLDTKVTELLQVYNDENVTVTIFGRPELIRKITPKDYQYVTPSSIGPVMLDYKKTVKTSDNRIYQFISSNKLRNDNNLIIILNPRNSQRIMYKIFDYQMYVGNEIRDTVNYQLPAITAFERFLFLQYQPVQGRILIANPSGLREDIQNNMPIGDRALNDYTANKVSYNKETKEFIDHSSELPGTRRSAMDIATNAANEFNDKTANVQYAYAPNYAVDQPSE